MWGVLRSHEASRERGYAIGRKVLETPRSVKEKGRNRLKATRDSYADSAFFLLWNRRMGGFRSMIISRPIITSATPV